MRLRCRRTGLQHRFVLAGAIVALALGGCSITYERSGNFDRRDSGAGLSSSWWIMTARQGDAAARGGRYRLALELYEKARQEAEDDADLQGMALTRGLIGDIYARLGQYDLAIQYDYEAVLILERIGDAANGGVMLMNMAALLDGTGKHDEAVEFLELALPLLEQSGELGRVGGEFFGTYASVLASAERYDEALEFYDRALGFPYTPDATRAGIVFSKGGIRFSQEKYEDALELFEQALELSDGYQMVKPAPLVGIGSVYEQRGELDSALDYYQQSIDLQDELLRGAGPQQFMMSMAQTQIVGYRRAVPVAARLGDITRAFELSEAARSRAFLQDLVTAENDRGGLGALQRIDSLRLRIRELNRELELAEAADDADEVEVSRLRDQIESVRRSLDSSVSSLDGIAVLVDSVDYADAAELADIQARLDDDTTLVTYFMAEDSVIAFVVDRESLELFVLPTSEKELEDALEQFGDFSAASARNLAGGSAAIVGAGLRDASADLGDVLIAPLRNRLTRRKVGIVPSGILNYVSFAAIEDDGAYFGDRHTVFYLPSASAITHLAAAPDGETRLLAVAPKNVDGFEPLEFADAEARSIAAMYGAEPLLGDGATETAVRLQVGGTSILHLAAHGELNPVKPMFSRVLLGADEANDGSLEVHEIYDLDLSNTDLVVLSACDTQLGPLSKGEDFVGLSRAFLAAGAPTVVASLWPVNDRATERLMTAFYTELKNGSGKAAALSRAQKTVRESFAHPYYWAAFVLSGDPGL